MRQSSVLAIAFLTLPLLSSCFSVTVDERTAFAPPKREGEPSATNGELQARWVAGLGQAETSGLLRSEPVSDAGTRVTFLKPRENATQVAPAMIVRHGFLGSASGRVAWSLFTGVDSSGAERGQGRPLVVHCAGNGGDRYNSSLSYASKALPWADVLVFDYPGYGDTPGPASAANFEIASKVLGDHIILLSQNRKLVFWGHSLGGFVCSRLASTLSETDGLVLETTAPNAAAVAKAWTPSYARLFVRASVVPSLASYDVVQASALIEGPVLVLGAAKDEVLPVTLARQVADGLKSGNAKVTYMEFPNARHMNVPAQAGFNDTVANFFKNVESQP